MSSKIYHSYFNGTYELVNLDGITLERSIYGPAPLQEVVRLIADINPSDSNWQREVVKRLKKARFRSMDLLEAPSNEIHASKVYYLASKCLSHAKLIFISLATIALTPGYLVKNRPYLALYLGLPTLKKIRKMMENYFFQREDNLLLEGVNYSFLDIIRGRLSRVLLPLFSHLSKAKDQPYISGTITINNPQATFDFELFDLLRTGLTGCIVARRFCSKKTLSDVLERSRIPISNWRIFGVGKYFDKFASFGVLTYSDTKLDEAFLLGLIKLILAAAPFLKGEISDVHKQLKTRKTISTSDLFYGILEMLEKKIFIPAEHIARFYKLDVYIHFERLKAIITKSTQTGSTTDECAYAISQYFCDLTTHEMMQRISKEVARCSTPPSFIKYLSILPYGGKVESLYRELASIAQFSRIEWPLIGKGVCDWGKGLFMNRNWRSLILVSGLALATSAAAYTAFKYVIEPHFKRWEHQTLLKLTARPQDETIQAFPKKFLETIPDTADYKIWHAIKKHVKGRYSAIPTSWQDDPVLLQRKCPIFATPIRIPVLLKIDGEPLKDGNANTLLFEEAHLQAWLNQQTSSSPITEHLPEWIPENFQFQDSVVEIERAASDQIELRCLLLKAKVHTTKTLWQELREEMTQLIAKEMLKLKERVFKFFH